MIRDIVYDKHKIICASILRQADLCRTRYLLTTEENDASMIPAVKKPKRNKPMEIKKKKLFLRIILCAVSAILLTVAVLYIINLIKDSYPDYVSAWRQDSLTTNTALPSNIEFFRNGSCTVDGTESDYKFSKDSVRIGEATYTVKYDANHMMLSSASGTASYQATGSSERYDYHIENGGAVIERYNGYQQTLVVPNELGGAPVTGIDSIHYHHLIHLTLPDSVTSIDSYAFGFNNNMEEIILSHSLRAIADHTFSECSALKHITVPEGIVSIGDHAFSECTALESVDLPESLRTIGESAFVFCPMLRSVSMPMGVTNISDSAFQNCVALESIAFPNGLTSIGSQAFYNCASLREIVLPESLLSLGSAAFYNCCSLEKVALTGNISVLEGSLFDSCSALKRIVIPNGVTTIDDYVFSCCSSLESVRIPKTLTNISTNAFSGCSHLAALTIAGDNPAYFCRDNALLSADDKVFYRYFDGSQNSSYTIPTGVETIKTDAFLDCTYLKQLKIPEGVVEISLYAFNGCSALKNISIPASAEDCSITPFIACPALKQVFISPDNPKFQVADGLLLSKDGSFLYECLVMSEDGTVVIPEGVFYISQFAYRNLNGIQSLWLPKSVHNSVFDSDSSAVGDVDYLLEHNTTVYAWKNSAAYAFAKKNGVHIISRQN